MRTRARLWLWGGLVAILAATAGGAAAPAADIPTHYLETPSLREDVEDGRLPPIAQRLPEHPSVAALGEDGRQIGRQGGLLRLLMGRERDIRLMVVNGYARLVGYDRNFDLVPDILRSIDVDDQRIFTFHLRKGMKWSDGYPFTAEDFRYYWQDMVLSKDFHMGVPPEMLVRGQPPHFEVINPTTVRYSWDHPNPFFLPALAGARPLFIYRAAHYLKQFNAHYADPAKLAALVKANHQRNWVALHFRKDDPYKFDNPDLPTLQPWVLRTPPPSSRFVFVRNPYYFRVDPEGRQLPYIDRVAITIASPRLIPAKTAAGESDLQARNLSFNDFTILKQGEAQNDYHARLWRTTKGSRVTLYPNLNVADPVWRSVLRDVRVRRALSLAIDRHEINQVIYFGLAREGNNTVLKESPLYRDVYRTRWAEFDIAKANRLLDEAGLTRPRRHGLRRLPDGRPMDIIVETAGEDPEQVDVLQLIKDTWREIGVRLFIKPLQREVMRNNVFSGSAMMSVWSGLDNGIPTGDTSPEELAPTSQLQLQWPKWGQFVETRGRAGKPVDVQAAVDLQILNREWTRSTGGEEKAEIWHKMLDIFTEQEFTIGIVSGVRQPVVVNDALHNVPEEGLYGWSPGAQFGVYRPDTFWFDKSRRDG